MYIGIDIGGREGKNTEIALLQGKGEYPTLTAIHSVPPNGDEFIIGFLRERADVIEGVGIDSPFDLPSCIRCNLDPCPGFEECTSEEAKEVVRLGGNPYAERLTEIHISNLLEEVRPMQTMALGQILARTIFLLKRLKNERFPVSKIREVYPKASLFAFKRILHSAPRDFSHAIRKYKTKDEGKTARALIIDSISPLVDFSSFREDCEKNHNMLDAVVAGLSIYYSIQELTLPRPEDLPADAGWIEVPDWNRIVIPLKLMKFGKG